MEKKATPKPPAKPVAWINWQRPMVRVLWACTPLVVAAVYFFGWRALATIMVCNVAAWLTERSFTRNWREPVSSAAIVTGTLFGLSLPPMLPMWMAALGAVFGMLFGKMVFGGFGRNVFNPAMTGRAFLYISFGNYMTAHWCEPFSGFPGGFARWGNVISNNLINGVDAIATATPGALMRQGTDSSIVDLLLGNGVSGVLGGTSAGLVILCGGYLVWKKIANHRIVYGALLGFLLFQTLAWWLGWGEHATGKAVDPLRAAFSASFLLGIFFYATDPITASTSNEGRWIFGVFVGSMSVLIATFSSWPAGTMFAILLANMFAPLMDRAIKDLKPAKRPAPKKAAPAAAKPAAPVAGGTQA